MSRPAVSAPSPLAASPAEEPSSPDQRTVYAGDASKNDFCDNRVITSKYTWWNFLFLFLWAKFRRYFLVICILQAIPQVSITNGVPTTAAPLAFVLAVDGLFTAIQDYNRHVSDRKVNVHSKVAVSRDGLPFSMTSWEDVAVGDIVKVDHDGRFPCDMVLLSAVHSADDKTNKHRRCHVNTKDLDGENNLKMRKALVETADLICNNSGEEDGEGHPVLMIKPTEAERDEVWRAWRGHVVCDPPDGDLDKFFGRIVFTEGPLARRKDLFVEKDNLLLRGTQLRNCAALYGIAVYTGYECKINFGSSADSKEKIPSLSGQIDTFVVCMFLYQVLLCLIGASGALIWNNLETTTGINLWYIPGLEANFLAWLLSFFTYFLLTSNLVPISLYVSIKISRQAQKFMMDRDRDMALVPRGASFRSRALCCSCSKQAGDAEEEEAAGKPEVLTTEVRTMELNDELGQITHIFSDKTGTMTCNDFKFRQISVDGVIFGEATTQIGVIAARAKAVSPAEKEEVARLQRLLDRGNSVENGVDKVRFLDNPQRSLWSALVDPASADRLKYFMYNLALNHTVELEPLAGGDLKYSSASPDEEAFAYAAKYFGFWYNSANGNFRNVSVSTSPGTPSLNSKGQAVWGGGQDHQFRLVALLPYSSARGMMSVIVEDLNVSPDSPKRFMLLAKGADNAIDEKLRPLPESEGARSPDEQAEYRVRLATAEHIKEFGSAGLRAMAFAIRFVSAGEVEGFLNAWGQARSAPEGQKRAAMAAAMNGMEVNMTLQGATAIEDQLQDKVADTIATLSRAGIRVYMLTGDKEETAINIGFGVNMLTKEFTQHIITLGQFQRDGLVPEDIGQLKDFAEPGGGVTGVQLVTDRLQMLRLRLQRSVDPVPQALIVDKDALAIMLGNEETRANLLFVAERCTSVICCRCRPLQKRAMLELIKDGVPGSKCLAVGDGANDVEMIKAANVGVGILGAEGAGAANASDFKVPQFKVLQKLLLVHGRWNYIRMALLVCYMFYKNCLFAQSQWWYVIFAGWSGQKFFIELATQTYNLFYTGIPILLIAVLDQDVDADSAQRFPRLFKVGQRGERLSVAIFGTYRGNGVATMQGASPSVFMVGTLLFTLVVIVVSIRIAMHTASHNWLYQLLLAACALFWIPTAYFYGALNTDGFLGGVRLTFQDGNWIASLPVLTTIALLPTMLFLLYRRYGAPTYQHMVRYTQIVLRAGRHGGFESVPRVQDASNKCMEPRRGGEWKNIEDQLLIT
ncbi:ALA3, partial [Symbiodinium sp. KB8]